MKLNITEDDVHILKICFEYAKEQIEREAINLGFIPEIQTLRKEWLDKIQKLERNLNAKVEE